jgi:hypothetical protein
MDVDWADLERRCVLFAEGISLPDIVVVSTMKKKLEKEAMENEA